MSARARMFDVYDPRSGDYSVMFSRTLARLRRCLGARLGDGLVIMFCKPSEDTPERALLRAIFDPRPVRRERLS